MWPYTDEETNWYGTRTSSQPTSRELTGELLAAHMCRARQLRAEALAQMLRQLRATFAKALRRRRRQDTAERFPPLIDYPLEAPPTS